MTAKEFFEQNRGKYFMYLNHGIEVVRLVGFSGHDAIISLYSGGWASPFQIAVGNDNYFIDKTLFDENDKLWYASISMLEKMKQLKFKVMKKKISYEYRYLMYTYYADWFGYIKKWYGWKKVMKFKDLASAEEWMKLPY